MLFQFCDLTFLIVISEFINTTRMHSFIINPQHMCRIWLRSVHLFIYVSLAVTTRSAHFYVEAKFHRVLYVFVVGFH
jgi:hypothetical protein